MARKSLYTSILQIDAQSISLLRYQQTVKKPGDLRYTRITGDWPDTDTQAEALRNFSQEQGLGEDRIFSILPRHEITTRILTLPSHDPKEIAGMVRFSAEEYVPYTLDELVIDQCTVKRLDSGESQVLAVLAHHDVVEKHLSLLRQAGLEVGQVFLSTACIASALVTAHVEEPDKYALVNLNAAGIEITIIDQGVPVFTRGIVGGQDWEAIAQEPDSGVSVGVLDNSPTEDLAAEIRGSLAAYRRESEDGSAVDVLYVACAYCDVERLCEALSEKTGKPCAPATFLLSLAGETRGLPGIPAEALGALLAEQERAPFAIGLLPAHETAARQLETTRILVIKAAVCLAVILVALGLLFFQTVFQRTQIIEELQRRVAIIEPNAQGIKEKREQLHILRRQVDRKGSIVEQLSRIVEAAPEDRLNFTRVSLRRNEGVNLWGRSKSENDVAQFTQSIRGMADTQMRFFARARSLYESRTPERNETVFAYHVEISALEEENDF